MDANVDKKKIIAAIVVIVVAVVGFVYFMSAGKDTQTNESATQSEVNVSLPSTNPADSIPQVNPIEKANPFKKTYENPFN